MTCNLLLLLYNVSYFLVSKTNSFYYYKYTPIYILYFYVISTCRLSLCIIYTYTNKLLLFGLVIQSINHVNVKITPSNCTYLKVITYRRQVSFIFRITRYN